MIRMATENDIPAMQFKPNPRTVWAPTVSCLREMMRAASFHLADLSFLDFFHRKENLRVPHVVLHADPI